MAWRNLAKNGDNKDFLPLLNEHEKNKASTYTRLDLRQKYIILEVF